MQFKGWYTYMLRDKLVSDQTSFKINGHKDPKIDHYIERAMAHKDKPQFKFDFKVTNG